MPLPNSSEGALPKGDQPFGGFGLYIHWPFCQAKCPYCDFNSHVVSEIDQARWQRAYVTELERYAAETPGLILNTVFFGGGTPSLMDPELVASILETVERLWPRSNSFEITLEANPTSIEADRFRAYRAAGVNRVSMGFQAMNDSDLRALGRLHSVAEAMSAYDIARSTFDRVSFDLIYARQNQTLADWQSELKQALTLAADHLSLYQLTIEQGTAFGDRHARGLLAGLPDEDLSADMYFATQDLCAAAGLPAYEISNHAAPGAESRHNLIYWRGGDYIGIGPGAHGRLTLGGTRFATDTALQPLAWLKQVEQDGSGEKSRTELSAEDRSAEYLMMGLRLSEGVSLARYNDLAQNQINSFKINELMELDLIETDGKTLRTTARGRPVLNGILRELLT